MTRTQLKASVTEAGRDFISQISKSTYCPRWFDTQTLINEYVVETIGFYNRKLHLFIEGGLENAGYREMFYGYFCALIGMLNILRDTGYYNLSEYGDITPFIDYCRSCWDTKEPIRFAEYETIRAFFEGREETS